MNERDTSSRLSKLDERLRTARHTQNVGGENRDKKSGGVGFAFRIGAELGVPTPANQSIVDALKDDSGGSQ